MKTETAAYSENLITGKVTPISQGQLDWEERKTKEMKEKLGDCDCECHWADGYGWVPEAGCPVHDQLGPTKNMKRKCHQSGCSNKAVSDYHYYCALHSKFPVKRRIRVRAPFQTKE